MRQQRIFLLMMGILVIVSPVSGDSQGKVVYFSAITLYHPIVMYQKYQPLMNYLTQHTPYRFELILSQDYRDIINFLKTNKVQVALLGGVTFVEAAREFEVIPILKPLGNEGEPYYRCVFIVQKANDNIMELADLKGKSIAFASKLSTSGYLAPLYHLYAKAGIKLEDFHRYQNFKYHDMVAREVLRGEFDAGAVIDSVANRFQKRGLKVLAVSDPIPGLPIAVRSDAPQLLIDSIKKALLQLQYRDPASRGIMAKWDEEFRYGFTEAENADYDIIRKMIRFLDQKGIKIPE